MDGYLCYSQLHSDVHQKQGSLDVCGSVIGRG